MKILDKVYDYRYTIFLLSLLLFMVMPSFFSHPIKSLVVFPAVQSVLFLSGIILLQKSKIGLKIIIPLAFLAIILRWLVLNSSFIVLEKPSLVLNLIFLLLVGYEIFNHLLNAKVISTQTIIGAFNGYILLGILGFFVFLMVEEFYPGSFRDMSSGPGKYEDFVYFSFVTITTIGYGDIVPLSNAAKKLSILLGLTGHFYLVVVMAVLIGKYLKK